MLLITVKITEACPKGADIAELVEVDKRVVELSNGAKERRPVWGAVYTHGLPLGENMATVPAPIDLKVADEVRVVAELLEDADSNGDIHKSREVYDVKRKGEIVWKNEAAVAAAVRV